MAAVDISPPPYASYKDVPPLYDVEKALNDFKSLSPDQKARLSTGMAKTATGNEALVHFKAAANIAAVAVDNIENVFVDLTAKLVALGYDSSKFVEQFDVIKGNFREVVKHSHEVAVKTSQYARSFETVVIKFCADETLSVDRRKKQIEEFIAEGKTIKVDSDGMQAQFTAMKDNFAKFVGSFATWAQSREEADQQKIKDLYEDIKRIDKKMAEIDAAILYLGIALAATLPATALLALIFPPAAPFIIAGGCIFAGLELTSLVGLVIAKNVLLNEKANDEGQIKTLQDEIGKIKAARTQLETNGQTALTTFSTNIQALAQIWGKVSNDALEVQGYLEKGGKVADQPAYMKDYLNEGVRVYTTMAGYLREYADGTTPTVTRFKAM